ncbi:MAG: hypothetical protein ACI90V_012888 [Bacillariaceae sp.]|jgi:hypothetical protein
MIDKHLNLSLLSQALLTRHTEDIFNLQFFTGPGNQKTNVQHY